MQAKRLLPNYILLFLMIILLLFLGEAFVRLNPKLYCNGYKLSQNDRIVYELYPGYELKSLQAKISSQGLNDRNFPLQKDPKVFRIAVVGDSLSFGWGVGADKGFPKVLEKMLNQDSNGRFEVINFSVPGYNTSQESELIKEKVLRSHPDMVILNYCGNDTHICNLIKSKTTCLNYLYNRSYFAHLLLRGIDFMVIKIWKKGIPRFWVIFKKNILGMFYCESMIYPYPGLEATVIIGSDPPLAQENVPERYWYMLGYGNYRTQMGNINTLLEKNRIRFVLSGQLDGEAIAINRQLGVSNICDFNNAAGINSPALFLEDQKHYNEAGNRLLARYLYDFLNNNGLLPSD